MSRILKMKNTPFCSLLDKAAKGNSEAQYHLGLRFCIKSIPSQAFHWLEKASKQGHSQAKLLLEELSERNLTSSTKQFNEL
jgi:TPR repeat protein